MAGDNGAAQGLQFEKVGELVPTFGFNADEMGSGENAAAWREAVGTLFEVDELALGEPGPFRADLLSYAIGPLVLGGTRASGQRFRRTLDTVARSGVDHVIVQIYTRGGYDGVAGTEPMRVRAGDVCVFDLGQTLETRATPFENITLAIPRPVIGARLARPELLHGLVLPGADVMAAMIGHHLRTLFELAPRMTASDCEAVVDSSVVLIAACLRAAIERREDALGERSFDLLIRIKQHVEARLTDAQLSGKTIADHFGLSRASLYRLFTPDGGVASYVRRRRLHCAFFDLAGSDCRVKEVAHRWRLGSEAQFIRAFRATYGITPSVARDTGLLAARHRAGEEAMSRLSQWMRRSAPPI